MYRISELAELVGLSRSTLLYYGKLGLIEAQRQSNGYRLYSEKDLQRVRLVAAVASGWVDAQRVPSLSRCKDRARLYWKIALSSWTKSSFKSNDHVTY